MGLIYWIVVGLIAGWLAGKVMKGTATAFWPTLSSASSAASSEVAFLECSAFGREGESSARLSSPSLVS